MKAQFCFIDDAQFELKNFQAHAAPAYERADFVYASSFEEAEAQFGDRRPVCFLLDIYGGYPGAQPSMPTPEQATLMLGTPPSAENLYAGIDETAPEGVNTLLRRFYEYVDRVQTGFTQVAAMAGQGVYYGVDNLAKVRQKYPWALAVGYSRKALYADGAAMTLAGADGVLQKPQGEGDDEIAVSTRQMAPGLANAVYTMLDRRLMGQAGALAMELIDSAAQENRMLGRALRLGVMALTGRHGDRRQTAAAMAELMAEGPVEGPAVDTALALRDWLAAGGGA